MTGADLLLACDQPADWGPWRLDPDRLTLSLRDQQGREGYYVDLERCLNSAQVLDWICQVAGKSYVDVEVLGGLVDALDDVLDPQARLCSFGQSTEITRVEVVGLVARAAQRWPHLTCRAEDR